MLIVLEGLVLNRILNQKKQEKGSFKVSQSALGRVCSRSSVTYWFSTRDWTGLGV